MNSRSAKKAILNFQKMVIFSFEKFCGLIFIYCLSTGTNVVRNLTKSPDLAIWSKWPGGVHSSVCHIKEVFSIKINFLST